MLSLARNGYTAAAVRAALHAAKRNESFRYVLYDKTGTVKANLTNMADGSMEYNALAAIKRTARFEIRDNGSENIDYLSDRIQPWYRLLMPDGGYAEFPLGVLLLSTPPRTVTPTGGVMRYVEAYDLGQTLLDDVVADRYPVLAGANVIDEVKSLLDSAGITGQNLVASSKTMPETRDWDPGTPKLTIINDMLRAIAYDELWFDENGVAVAKPYVSPDEQAVLYTYTDDDESVTFPDMEQSLDLFRVPNRWIRTASEADWTLRSEYTNSNPNSPTSTVNRGRTITDVDFAEAVDQASLDSLTRKAAIEASQVYETVQFGTLIMPMHSHMDVLNLQQSKLQPPTATRYQEVGWSMQLKAGTRMNHVVRRVVTV